MKSRGFTLAELIGVITLLGIIVIIAFPPLIKQIKETESKLDEATKQLIVAGASNYVEENKNDYPKTSGNVYCVTLQTLVDEGDLSKDLKDSEGNEIDLNKYVKINIASNQYNYNIVDSCTEVK